MNETIYSVRLKYTVDDKAGAGVKKLTKDVEGLGDVSGKVVGLIAGVGGAFLGIESAKKHLIDFNSEVQNAKIGLSAMIQGNLGTTWDRATERANGLYNEFQKFSTLTPVTTQEILGFGKSVAVATFQAGGSIKQLTNITEQGVIAAKAFGYESAYSALELSEMLAGNVNKRMMFAKQLLGIAKVDEKDFNKMSGEERLGIVQKVLNSDAMKNAAQAFGQSWSGVISTLEDKLQILVGKVGLPLFKRLTKEVSSWNDWIDKNTGRIEAFGARFGEALVDGFNALRTGVGFLVDHADLLLTVGKVWAAVRIGGMLGGGIAGGAGGAGGKIASLIAWGSGIKDKFDENGKYQYTPAGAGRQNVTASSIGGALPMLGQSLAAGYAIGSVINEQTGASSQIADSLAHLTGRVDATTDRFDQLQRSSKQLDDAMSHRRGAGAGAGAGGFTGTVYNANLLGMVDKYKADINAADDFLRTVNTKGIGSDEGKAAFAAYQARGVSGKDLKEERASLPRLLETQTQVMSSSLGGYLAGINKLNATQIKSLDVQEAQEQIMQYMASQNDARAMFQGLGGAAASGFAAQQQAVVDYILRANMNGKLAEKPNVNITIQRIEVQSDDPDRYAFALVEAFRDSVKNPSAAVRALREG
jgi:hypothetical protein